VNGGAAAWSSRKGSHRRSERTLNSSTIYSPFYIATMTLMLLAIVVGGASRENIIQVSLLNLAGLALMPWSAFRFYSMVEPNVSRLPVIVLGLIVSIGLVQLIPLPPAIWSSFGGRQLAVEVYEAANVALPWRPISLTPELTLRSILSLAAPASIFLSVATFSTDQRRHALMAVLGVAVLGLFLGALQIAGGTQSAAYLYRNTNAGSLVGFFSNRNHQASFLLCLLPLFSGLVATSRLSQERKTASLILCLGVFLGVTVSLLAIRSRAGALLLGPSVLFSLAVLSRSGMLGRIRRVGWVIAGVIVLILLIPTQIGIAALLERFDTDIASDLRFVIAPDIWQASLTHFPIGSGLGSFDAIYRSVERTEIMRNTFVNHAHNDYLEVFLELGAASVVVLAAFLFWWLRATYVVWRARHRRDIVLGQAASVAIGILILHSGLDYPLRTVALSCLFAFSCALLVAGEISGLAWRSAKRAKVPIGVGGLMRTDEIGGRPV